jgi:5-methylcytosine-specific restriction endonuclease McrA
VVAVLESGRRVATYKLASLIALLDYAVEHLPAEPDAALAVPVRDLAERVIEIYWLQVLPFDGAELRQSTGPTASILQQTVRLRTATGAGYNTSLAVAKLGHHSVYQSAVSAVALTLARQPLHRLQRIGTVSAAPFLYDDSWLHDGVSSAELAAHQGSLQLLPGVAWSLARLTGLLRPLVETLWTSDVRRWNHQLSAEVPDIAGHLFGRDRVQLKPARDALADAYGTQCFYCGASVGKSGAADHVLPWSRIGLDGLTNLVLSCQRCNTDKSATLPRPGLVEQAISRDPAALEQLSESINWPSQRHRTISAARGLYRTYPSGSPVWASYHKTLLFGAVHEDWLLAS